jgi:hypothetical protein
VNIHKQDDLGAPLAGAVFTLYTNNAPLTAPRGTAVEDPVTSFTCTTNASGDCSMLNVPFGNYWAVETSGVAGHDLAADQSFTLSSSTPSLTISLTFIDPRQVGAIKVIKNAKNKNCGTASPPDGCSGGNSPLAGAGFEIWQESNGAANLQTTGATPDTKIANQQLTVLSGSGASTVASTCFSGLFFANNYYVHESLAPSGYAAAADQTAAIATTSTCAGSPVTKTFTDTPLSQIRVTFHSKAGVGVTTATIQCTGDASASNLPDGLSGTGRTLDDLVPGTYACTVVVDP